MWWRNYGNMLSHFHRIPERDRQTDRWTELLYQHRMSVQSLGYTAVKTSQIWVGRLPSWFFQCLFHTWASSRDKPRRFISSLTSCPSQTSPLPNLVNLYHCTSFYGPHVQIALIILVTILTGSSPINSLSSAFYFLLFRFSLTSIYWLKLCLVC